MHKTLTSLLALSLVIAAGCGSDDSSGSGSTPAKKPAAKPAAATGPGYAAVKKLALKDPKVAKLCPDGGEDNQIGAPEAGEKYTRLICGGREVFDYVAGKGQFARNYKASVKLATNDLWRLGSVAYVGSDAFGGPKELATQVKESCGCGEVVPGGYGR